MSCALEGVFKDPKSKIGVCLYLLSPMPGIPRRINGACFAGFGHLRAGFFEKTSRFCRLASLTICLRGTED